LTVQLKGIELLPLTKLKLSFVDKHATLKLPPLSINCSDGHSLVLSYPISFPHRGVWNFNPVTAEISDQFGLFRWRWTLQGSQFTATIDPPHRTVDAYPVISSSFRSGDAVPELQKRDGDPFDIKSYNPSDSLRRIVWKLFAKSGVLHTRYPEPSITPEGVSCLFVLANQMDDDLCSEVEGYCRMLESLDVDLIGGCLGMQNASCATSGEAMRELLVSSVWACESGDLVADFLQFKLATENMGVSMEKVIFFCSSLALGEKFGQLLSLEAGSIATKYRINPVFLVTKNNQIQASRRKTGIGWPISWLFKSDNIEKIRSSDPLLTQNFFSACMRENWEATVV